MTEASQMEERIARAVDMVRATSPMVGSVTNVVTIDLVANAQLAVGGSAAMVYLPDEGECLVAAGATMYLNMGTLLPVHEEALLRVAAAASASDTPWVLDPVGIGIGQMRSNLLMRLKEYRPTIARGNASEIIALAGLWDAAGSVDDLQRVRGVDSTDEVVAARDAAIALARYTGGAVVVSGPCDLVTDGWQVALSYGGCDLMPKVTGMGCSQGGVLAVYAGVADAFAAALAGVNHYNLAGAKAATRCDGPASFRTAFIDELYRASADEVAGNPFVLE